MGRNNRPFGLVAVVLVLVAAPALLWAETDLIKVCDASPDFDMGAISCDDFR